MHPLIAQQLVADRIDGFVREAEAQRLAAVTAEEHAPRVAIRERVLHAVGHAVGRVHLIHRGSAA
jgi:hypothetical protein